MRDDKDDQTCSLDNLFQVSDGDQVLGQLDIRQVSLILVRRVDDLGQVSALYLSIDVSDRRAIL